MLFVSFIIVKIRINVKSKNEQPHSKWCDIHASLAVEAVVHPAYILLGVFI
jgi:hypothetical protein